MVKPSLTDAQNIKYIPFANGTALTAVVLGRKEWDAQFLPEVAVTELRYRAVVVRPQTAVSSPTSTLYDEISCANVFRGIAVNLCRRYNQLDIEKALIPFAFEHTSNAFQQTGSRLALYITAAMEWTNCCIKFTSKRMPSLTWEARTLCLLPFMWSLIAS